MKETLKKRIWCSIMTSILFTIFSMILITNPSKTLRSIAYILGGFLIIQGIIILINSASNKNRLYRIDPISGTISIIIGIITIIFCKELTTLFRILISIWIIYNALIKMNISIKLKKIDTNICIYSFIIATAMLASGIFILITQNAILITIGILIFIYSILDIIENLILISNVNRITKTIK